MASTSGTAASPPTTLPRLPDPPSSPKSESSNMTPHESIHPPSPPLRQDSALSGTWSTVATPGVKESTDAEEAFDIPSVPTTIGQAPAPRRPSVGGLRQERSEGHEKKGVRFAGPDGAPLSPSATVVTIDSYVAPDAPPPSAFEETEEGIDRRESERGEPPIHQDAPVSEEPPVRSTRQLPSAPASLPAVPAVLPSAPTMPTRIQPTPSAPAEPEYPSSLDSKSIERCQKHARWAISALDYEDLETARKELRQALALLEGR